METVRLTVFFAICWLFVYWWFFGDDDDDE